MIRTVVELTLGSCRAAEGEGSGRAITACDGDYEAIAVQELVRGWRVSQLCRLITTSSMGTVL